MTPRHAVDLEALCVARDTPIRDAAARMDRQHIPIVLVVDADRRLAGTVTDGDLRRAILARVDFERPVQVLLDKKRRTKWARPITAPAAASVKALEALFHRHNVLYLPLVDKEGLVTGLAARDDVLPPDPTPLHAVVMAGGRGSRLFPLTKDTPKPLLKVGDKPILEIILRQLGDAGVRRVHVTTHHHAEKIRGGLGDGKPFGLDIDYIHEDRPLGTAGALASLGARSGTTLVMNGDVLTRMNFRQMLKFHRDSKAELTAAVCQYDLAIPYGVIECAGSRVVGLSEKPKLEFFVGAGIYLLEPSACRLIPKGRRFDMTDLIAKLLKKKRRVTSFPIREYWLDIGKPADYERAQRDFTADAAAKAKAAQRP